MKPVVLLLMSLPAFGAVIPAGTEISVRLLDKIASEATPAADAPVRAVVIAPGWLRGLIVIPAGPTLSGLVKDARAADGTTRAQLRLDFTSISMDAFRASI